MKRQSFFCQKCCFTKVTSLSHDTYIESLLVVASMMIIAIIFFPNIYYLCFHFGNLKQFFIYFLSKQQCHPTKGTDFKIDLLFNLVSVFEAPFVKQFCLANVVTLNCSLFSFSGQNKKSLFKPAKCSNLQCMVRLKLKQH